LSRQLGLRIVTVGALIVLLLGLVLWGTHSLPWRTVPLTPQQREAAARQQVSGIRISTRVPDSTLAASKALVDFLATNDVRLVLVRIVDDLRLEIHVESDQAVALGEPPSFCVIGPYSAPDDGGYSSPCWGTPDLGELVLPQLPTDGAGHPMIPAGRDLVLSATVQRGGLRCDYPPGQWLLVVKINPLVDGTPMGVRELPEIGFDVPWAVEGPLPFLAVRTVAYCGSANLVYRDQGEPEVASPSP
jgi:hypothetical protein